MVHAVAYTYAEVLEEMWKSYKEVAGPLPTPCWVWTKKRFHRGYGDICYQRKHRQVHRFAWESLHGPIPKGLLICHKCDNPPCFRPDHLFLGTNRDNVLDCLIKSRFSRVKLAPQDVAEIRNAYANGVASQGQLSKRFGVSQWHIWGIIHGRFWKHLLDPMP